MNLGEGGARIGLDVRAADAVPTGLTTYARGLVAALTHIDATNTYVIIRRPDSGGPFADGPHVEEVLLRGDASTPTWGGPVSRLGLDLYHSLHHFLPYGLRVPRIIVTLHDLIWIEHRALIRSGGLAPATRWVTHLYARAAMGYALRRADRVIAISAFTRERGVAHFGLAPDKVDVVHHGVDHGRFTPAAAAPQPVGTPYFLCLGNGKPYKNLGTAVRAFALCADRMPGIRLVIAGRGDSLVELGRLAAQLHIADRVTYAGFADDHALLTLLHGALALVFPSLVEGFGLPVLEAMAAGCPVIASSAPTLVEVTGGAALLCDPLRPEAFADAMTRVEADAELRRDLRNRGLARAAGFTWGGCAEQTLRIYREMLAPAPAAAPMSTA